MGDSDLWRADGSFRGIQGTGSGKGSRGKGGSAPQFTRVIPKFLQKYHEPPAIQAKFAPPPMPDGEEDDGELDEVQQAAMDAYLEKDKEKREEIAKAVGDDDADAGDGTKNAKSESGKKKASQVVAGVGATQPPKEKKKRKRAEAATLSNKKLLSFSMDDEE
ncbi:hypothetical protein FI667_g6041, partial [Globisporangium splendens]